MAIILINAYVSDLCTDYNLFITNNSQILDM